jgi:hypothetical protein
MDSETKQSRRGRLAPLRKRLGPVGMSLAAAALTAAAFAAISVADSDNSKDRVAPDEQTMWAAPPPGGGVGVMSLGGRLSDEDRNKLEEFRQCMEDNGAPAPPEPGAIDPSEGPPEPPSEADMEKIEAAYEACKDELPEELRNGHPPHLSGPGCAHPPDVPQKEGQNRQGSGSESGTQSSGAAA